MTKYILDISKWRSGGNGVNKVGEGETMLLNKEGFMCCLGQFCSQEGVAAELLEGVFQPEDVCTDIHLPLMIKDGVQLRDSYFSSAAIAINDCEDTPVSEKIKKLKSLCEEKGIELEVTPAEYTAALNTTKQQDNG